MYKQEKSYKKEFSCEYLAQNKFFKIFGLLLFAFIATICILTEPVAGLGITTIAFAPVIAGLKADGTPKTSEEMISERLKMYETEISRLGVELSKFDKNNPEVETQIKSLNERIEKFNTHVDAIKEISKELKALKETQKVVNTPKFKAIFRKSLEARLKEIKEGKSEIRDLINEKGEFLTGEKAVATMSDSGSLTGNVIIPDIDTELTDVFKRRFVFADAVMKRPTSSPTIWWMEKTAAEGTAAMTAEGASKSQISWKYEQKSTTTKKITAYIKITTEMLEDVDGIMADIDSELMYQIGLLEETQILTGNGSGQNINGITVYAQPLDLASLAGSVPGANEFDSLQAAITQIFVNTEGGAIPTHIFMNPADVFKLRFTLKTNTEEDYIFPPYLMPNGFTVEGITITKTNSITAGNLLVGDMLRYNLRNLGTTRLAMGLDGQDFTNNCVTILAEKRLAGYVKANHAEAFVYESFTDAKAFLNQAS